MAEALAVGASVIAIIQISDRIIGLCKFYVETARDAPSDLRVILIETSALKTILENLNFLAACDGPDSPAARCISGADGPIEGCLRTVTELEKFFPSNSVWTEERKTSKRRKLNSVLTALAWPLKESKARKLLDEMMRYKTTIGLALTTNSIQDVQEVKKKASQIHDILTESQRHEVHQWLQHTDPSPLHRRAQKDYETGTGNWILSSPEWTDWLAGIHRCLWIHGIPGAGKTVLISYLIGQIGEFCNQVSHRGSICVYYYCYFAHNQDEAEPFLKWVISRLCRKAGCIPTYVYDLSKHGTKPSLIALLEALAQILVSFETVYIALDAIDESTSKDDLLQVLQTLVTDRRFKGVQLVTSSRKHIDIERTMSSCSASISMNNPFVEEDIRCYVRSNLKSNPRFEKWPPDLLNEVEDSLTSGAGGMFRWAVCQIDSLQRLKYERKMIQKALKNLPKTLNETYDRIFLAVPEEERLFVDHALRWIAHHDKLFDRRIPCQVLIEAAEASMLRVTGNQNERFYDRDTLREVCGCLIDISPEHSLETYSIFRHTYSSVSFAHYTVREYLDKNRTSDANLSYHSVGGGDFNDRCLDITLSEAQRIERNESWDSVSNLTDEEDVIGALVSSFHNYCKHSALVSLSKFPSRIGQHNTLSTLAMDLLDPTMPHFPILEAAACAIDRVTGSFSPETTFFEKEFRSVKWHPDTNSELRHLYNLLLLVESRCEYLPLANRLLQGKDLKSLLQARLHFNRPVSDIGLASETYLFKGPLFEVFAQLAIFSIVPLKFLVEVGAGLFDPSIALLLFIGGHDHSFQCTDVCPLQRLLELRADPNLRGYRVTPLQVAAYCSDYEGVEMLLKAGAMPNDTGCPDGVIWEEDSVMHDLNQLHGASPLLICRAFPIMIRLYDREVGPDDRKKIEALLLYHGAEAFSTEPGPDIPEIKTTTRAIIEG